MMARPGETPIRPPRGYKTSGTGTRLPRTGGRVPPSSTLGQPGINLPPMPEPRELIPEHHLDATGTLTAPTESTAGTLSRIDTSPVSHRPMTPY